ncbi:MAG: phosphatase PAP2 family protein [Acidimicrobiales bacterium]
MWLAWEIAAVVALLLGILWLVARRIDGRRAEFARPFLRELTTMFALYTLWQLAGRISVVNKEGAFRRGQQLWDFERLIYLPNEATLQEWLLPYSWAVQAVNIYYAVVHVPAMIGCLIWLFLRDRHYYAVTRNNLTMLTGGSLLIQLVAVAPPRFIEGIGMVDTAVLYNQSVFSSLGSRAEGQLQAMPSIHVGWALLVGLATWVVGTGKVKWLGPIHAAITFVVVAVTANHYWLDGIVAGVVLVASMYLQRFVRRRLLGEPAEQRRAPTRAEYAA